MWEGVGFVPKKTAVQLSAFFAFTGRIVSNMEYGGRLHKVLIREQFERQGDVWKIGGAIVLLIAVNFFFPHASIEIADRTIPIFYLALAIVGFVVAYSLVRILASLMYLLDVFEESVLGRHDANYKKFERNITLAVLLAIGFVLVPGVIEVMQLPEIFLWLRSIPLILAAVLVWSAVKNQYATRNQITD